MRPALVRKREYPNNITFPRALRDAIPDHELSMGRVLKLATVDAQAAHTVQMGRRVQIKLHVCETGKLEGEFDVWIDIESEAAKAFANLVTEAATQADRLKPVDAWAQPN